MSEPELTGKQVISRAIGQVVEFLPNGFVVEIRFDGAEHEAEVRFANSKDGKRYVEARRWMLREVESRNAVISTVANEMIRCLHRLCVAVGVEFRGP